MWKSYLYNSFIKSNWLLELPWQSNLPSSWLMWCASRTWCHVNQNLPKALRKINWLVLKAGGVWKYVFHTHAILEGSHMDLFQSGKIGYLRLERTAQFVEVGLRHFISQVHWPLKHNNRMETLLEELEICP